MKKNRFYSTTSLFLLSAGTTKRGFLVALLAIITLGSCRDVRINDHKEWGAIFTKYGITNGCFILRDHAHEQVNVYNRERCLTRYSPASTFKIFNSLVALETGVAVDDNFVIPWDSVVRSNKDWNQTMNLRKAFEVSNVPFFQELARRNGPQNLQHYLDTVKYGNMRIGNKVDEFWLNDTLQISADEQVGFLKRFYFEELPFSVRSQTIVRSMMLREDSTDNKLYYKTGWSVLPNKPQTMWIVGFLEHAEHIKENKESMNKSGVRNYPFIFALNFDIPGNDTSRNWRDIRVKVLHELLTSYGAFNTQ